MVSVTAMHMLCGRFLGTFSSGFANACNSVKAPDNTQKMACKCVRKPTRKRSRKEISPTIGTGMSSSLVTLKTPHLLPLFDFDLKDKKSKAIFDEIFSGFQSVGGTWEVN